jgi:siroheme synthase-like protein
MQALPIFMNINQRLCVVIGAGEVAARKVTMLLRAQASVTVYAPEICPTLADLVEAGRIRYQPARFADQQLSGACLVIAATNVSERDLGDALGAAMIGDAVAARNAAMAIYEGRKLARAL